jgi:hypothetical protein
MHMTAVLDAIKKHGTFKDYKKAEQANVEAKKAAESAEAGLALLKGISAGSKKNRKKKALAKAKGALAQETKSETKEAEEATNVTEDLMKAGFQVDLEKAKKAMEETKDTMTAAASQMFMFHSNLLSPESKYSWNKIFSKQTESDPSVNLQGVSLEGRGECLASRLTIASCFTFSLRFPSTQLSKKSTTSQMYLRSPSASTYSVCTSCKAAQRLHCPDAMLLPQPQCQCQHQAQERSVHGG